MKILQVIPYFVPSYSYGGPVKVCFDISKELASRGHDVTVVTTDTLDVNNRITNLEEVIEGVKIIRFRNVSNRLAKRFNGYIPLGFYQWVKKNITQFDVVHCHDFYTLQNIIISHFCNKNNVPFVIQPHGTLSPVSRKARFKTVKSFFITLFQGILKNAKHIFSLTVNEREDVLAVSRDLAKKIKIIPNGLQKKEFENISKINLHVEYKIPAHHKLIGYIGRIQYIKGIDISLDILANVKKNIDFTYLIIGPNEGEKDKLEQQIKKLGLDENVVFCGILTGMEKLQTISSCDLFIFTSRSEGLPMTILEVAALGVPQVISNNCNVPELSISEAGYTFDLEEIALFEEKILAILSDEHLRNKLAANSINMIAEYFDLGLVCDKIERAI